MATHPGPRPKRKDYLSKSGFEFALSSWQTMADLYRRDKEQERQERQAQRQREREARAAEARAARQQQREPKKRQHPIRGAGTIVSAAFQVYTAATNPGLAAGALPGHQGVAGQSGEEWKNASQQEQRDWQSQQIENGTRDTGNRRGWSGGK